MTDAISSRASILVVDDELSVQKLLVRALGRGGYDGVETASSAREARAVLADREFDLLLTDMQMPGGSGLDLLMHVRDEQPDTATMMVTGVDDTTLADQALDIGAYGYIIKPFKHSEVLINVSNALRRRALERENKDHRDRLEDKVRERTSGLWDAIKQLEHAEKAVRTSRSETIRRLAIAGEFRDEDTGRHVARMSLYCEVLSRAAGRDEEFCCSILEASQMHDVGKIGIPDSILLKPLGLTDDERRVMQTHTELGGRILCGSESPLLDMAATIALTHHERFDGSGYPNGLSGTDIPLEGRIASICDVFDALTTNRVYRRAFPVGVAVEMMKAAAGSQFDPALLDRFWDVLPEILCVKEANDSGGVAAMAGSVPHAVWDDIR